jgi:formyl-CoA transferase/CoA:oxalate CoA-transferase
MMLGDLGASVIKVERPGRGDQARGYGPPFVSGESTYFMSLNRNKRSLVLDLTAESGQEIMHRLLLRADVFLLNLPRQSSWEKFGFDYDSISAENPSIIYAAISGYGHTGARAGQPGYDVIAQAEAGTMSLTGEPGGAPMRFPTPMADMTTGLYAALGILAALQAREQTGKGQLIDLSLIECQLSWLTSMVPAYLLTGEAPGRLGNAHPTLVPYRQYQARDKAFVVGVGTDPIWRRFCEAIGHPKLSDDPRFVTNADRVRNRESLEPILDAHFARKDASEWIEGLRAERIPCGAVNSLTDILADAHLQDREGLVELEHPTVGPLKMLSNPLHLSATPPVYERHPPTLGEHSQEILHELGYSTEEIRELEDIGVV